jgi:hypothetical protein
MTQIIQSGKVQQQVGPRLTTIIPIRIKHRGGRKVVIPSSASDARPEHDAPILTALSKAFHWQRLIDEGVVNSGSDIARREGLDQSCVNELLRLTLLSPAMVRNILNGHQPKTLNIYWLKNNELPSSWDEQEKLFGSFDA